EVDVVQRGPVRDEDASGTRGGSIGSRGRKGIGEGKKMVGTSGVAKWFGLQDEPADSSCTTTDST
ncbi:hypothetical protein Tco_0614178, partial [Tanacetum coccineum]